MPEWLRERNTDRKVQEESSSSQNVNLCITSCQRGTSRGSYRICLEDGSSFFISIDFFIKHKLRKGVVLDSHLYELVKIESLFVEAYNKAVSLLGRQLYSTFNIRKKLLQKKFSAVGVDFAIDKLTEQGYLDDYKYAYKWVESRLRNKLDSYNSLLSSLIVKGISANIGRKVLAELYSPEAEEIIIKKSIEKYCRQGKTSDKITNALMRKGFNRKLIFKYLDRET